MPEQKPSQCARLENAAAIGGRELLPKPVNPKALESNVLVLSDDLVIGIGQRRGIRIETPNDGKSGGRTIKYRDIEVGTELA